MIVLVVSYKCSHVNPVSAMSCILAPGHNSASENLLTCVSKQTCCAPDVRRSGALVMLLHVNATGIQEAEIRFGDFLPAVSLIRFLRHGHLRESVFES